MVLTALGGGVWMEMFVFQSVKITVDWILPTGAVTTSVTCSGR